MLGQPRKHTSSPCCGQPPLLCPATSCQGRPTLQDGWITPKAPQQWYGDTAALGPGHYGAKTGKLGRREATQVPLQAGKVNSLTIQTSISPLLCPVRGLEHSCSTLTLSSSMKHIGGTHGTLTPRRSEPGTLFKGYCTSPGEKGCTNSPLQHMAAGGCNRREKQEAVSPGSSFLQSIYQEKKHSKITSHQNIFPHPSPAQVGTEPKAPCPLPRLPSEPSSCSRHLLPVSPSPRVQKVEREIKTQVNTH